MNDGNSTKPELIVILDDLNRQVERMTMNAENIAQRLNALSPFEYNLPGQKSDSQKDIKGLFGEIQLFVNRMANANAILDNCSKQLVELVG